MPASSKRKARRSNSPAVKARAQAYATLSRAARSNLQAIDVKSHTMRCYVPNQLTVEKMKSSGTVKRFGIK